MPVLKDFIFRSETRLTSKLHCIDGAKVLWRTAEQGKDRGNPRKGGRTLTLVARKAS
jgi:hypothetical protein